MDRRAAHHSGWQAATRIIFALVRSEHAYRYCCQRSDYFLCRQTGTGWSFAFVLMALTAIVLTRQRTENRQLGSDHEAVSPAFVDAERLTQDTARLT